MIELGDKVKDTVSGFEGVAVSSHRYLQGCMRITVQPLVGGDGKLPEVQSFDEPQLEVVEGGYVFQSPEPVAARTGGPERHPDKPRR